VVEAYAQLVAEGYLVARQGDGTRVARTMAGAAATDHAQPTRLPPPRYNLGAGIPDLSAFPRHEWAAAIAKALRELPYARLGYPPMRGLAELREPLAAYLGRVRAVASDPEQIVVTCGCIHGMSLLWNTLRLRGAQRIALEDPCLPWIRAAVVHAGLEPVPIPVDEHGLRVEALERARVSAVAVSPAHQYPTGSVLAPDRRGALIAWARAHDALIVEDDYDAEFRYDRDPIGSLQGLAPDRVAYLGSVSKTLAPGLSLGWMAVPHPLAGEVASALRATRGFPSVFVQAAYATLLEKGSVDRHLRRMRRVYRTRRDKLITALGESIPGSRVAGASAGLHIVLWLGENLEEQAFATACARQGVAVDTLHGNCDTTHELPPALILGYGRIDTPTIPAAVRAMERAVAQTGPERSPSATVRTHPAVGAGLP
jgi:GntR family transcriptional regulator/MocR family aminotransferase